MVSVWKRISRISSSVGLLGVYMATRTDMQRLEISRLRDENNELRKSLFLNEMVFEVTSEGRVTVKGISRFPITFLQRSVGVVACQL